MFLWYDEEVEDELRGLVDVVVELEVDEDEQ